jgi:hypothetical protein
MGRYILIGKKEKKNSPVQKKTKRGSLSKKLSSSNSLNRIQQLQKTVGNRAVQRMIRNGTVPVPGNVLQAKEAGEGLAESLDPVQREEMPEEETPQMKFAAQRVTGPEDEEIPQLKPATQRDTGLDDEDTSQMKFAIQRQPGMDEQDALQPKTSAGNTTLQRTGNNSAIPEDLQGKMDKTFQADFSDVKIHPNSTRAPEVGALAYTQGSDIHFAPGQFKPDTSGGKELLGHELTHVLQQREGKVKPTTQVNGVPVNDNSSFENEADAFGRKLSRL